MVVRLLALLACLVLSLEHGRRSHAAADAHGGDSILCLTALELIQQGADLSRACMRSNKRDKQQFDVSWELVS